MRFPPFELWVRSALWVLSSREPLDWSNSENSLGRRLRRNYNSAMPPPVATRPLFFGWCDWLLIFKATTEFGRGNRLSLKVPHKTVLTKTYSCFLNKCSQIAVRLWLISRVLKKLILTIFLSIFLLLLWRIEFLKVLSLQFCRSHSSIEFWLRMDFNS